VRIKLLAELAGARIPMQIDIGFGDAVYPEPELASFPVLLPMEAPLIRAYPRESAVAEKFHAMAKGIVSGVGEPRRSNEAGSHLRNDAISNVQVLAISQTSLEVLQSYSIFATAACANGSISE
jgi:hypothetical protein